MDVGLNSGQLALRDSVRDVLRTECPPGVARQAMTDPERWRTVWKTVVELGWTELAVPADGGEGSFGRVDLAVVLEECGAAIAPIPLLSSIGLAAGVLRAAGSAVDDVLAAIGGGVVAALAVPPPGCRLPGVPMTLQSGHLHGTGMAFLRADVDVKGPVFVGDTITVIVEVTGSAEKIDNFVDLMRPYGIKELARSGVVALVRGDQARFRLMDFASDGDEPQLEPSRQLGVAGDTTGTV